MSTDSPERPRIQFPISELLIVVAIVSTLWVLLFPAVNAARNTQNLPQLLPRLQSLFDSYPWLLIIGFPIGTTAGAALVFVTLQRLVPPRVRRFFPWKSTKESKAPPLEPIADSRPAVLSLNFGLAGFAILLLAAWHVRVDRTQRRPIVTWEGPFADFVPYLAALGWSLSGLALVVGVIALTRFRSRFTPLAAIGIGIAILNYFGSCLFSGIVYED